MLGFSLEFMWTVVINEFEMGFLLFLSVHHVVYVCSMRATRCVCMHDTLLLGAHLKCARFFGLQVRAGANS